MLDVVSLFGKSKFTKKQVRGMIIQNQEGLVPIKYEKIERWKHVILGNPPAVKISPRFINWSCTLNIEYDPQIIGLDDILSLLNLAGKNIGVGADKPKGRCGGSGSHGKYKVFLDMKK